MVPVLDQQNKPLMPCTEKRARKLLTKGQAFSFWKKGVFCIRLFKEPSFRNFQKVIIGIDPGSKREAYTIATNKIVVLNILSDTPWWVKDALKSRREARRGRRFRKTPCRKPKWNNLKNIKRLAPSTKSRWQTKLRILNWLSKIFPLTDIIIENVRAKSRKGAKKWNISFSPLEVGKEWFYSEAEKRFNLHAVGGYDTKRHRDLRGFLKVSNKLQDSWNSHNIDSHCLCEMLLKKIFKPVKIILRIAFIQLHRRQLHRFCAIKGKRKRYGGTISLGLKRGSLVEHEKYGLTLVGGHMLGRLSLHSLVNNNRVCRSAKLEDCEFKTYLSWRYYQIGGKAHFSVT